MNLSKFKDARKKFRISFVIIYNNIFLIFSFLLIIFSTCRRCSTLFKLFEPVNSTVAVIDTNFSAVLFKKFSC